MAWHFSHFLRRLKSAFIGLLALIRLFIVASVPQQLSADDLPLLGDSVSGVIAWEREAELGDTLFRLLKASAPIIEDPSLNDYIEHLVYELASVSELNTPKLHIAIINSPDINAFAMPGGVIGINAGLFLHSYSEDELAAVVAHELAHLSQRHFARALDKAKQARWASLTSILASIVVATTTGSSDAGIATFATTQAASLQSQLRFSRQNEYEADRIGILTLNKAGFDPHAMPRFFGRLANAQRFSTDHPYEFLRTHPVTQARISDSQARAQQITTPTINQQDVTQDRLEFELMKSKIRVAYAPTGSESITWFKSQLNQSDTKQSPQLAYGLALAYARADQYASSNEILKSLLKNDPHRVTYITSIASNLTKDKQPGKAVALLNQELALNPDSFPLTIGLAEALVREDLDVEAMQLLVQLLRKATEQKPQSNIAWALLRDTYSFMKNQVGVHLANAELKYLSGQPSQAITQAELALELVLGENLLMREKIRTRIAAFKLAQETISL